MNIAAPVIVPALIAGIVWLVAGRLWHRPAAPTLVFGGALAMAISFFAGHVALVGQPPFPPATALHSLVFAALVVGVVGSAESIWRLHWATRWPIRALLALGVAWWQFNTLAEHSWNTTQTIGWITTITLTICVVWDALDTYANRHTGIATPLLMWLFACATSVALVFGASAMMGQLAGCVAAACGAAVVLALWAHPFPLDRGAAGVFAFILSGLLWQGYFYAELPLLSTALLIAAPVAVFAVDARIPANGNTRTRLIAVFGSMLILTGIAIGIAYTEYRTAAAEVEEYIY